MKQIVSTRQSQCKTLEKHFVTRFITEHTSLKDSLQTYICEQLIHAPVPLEKNELLGHKVILNSCVDGNA
jgi:hypothetical protein